MAVKTWLRTQLQGFSSEKPLLFARFLRKLPALWRQELAMAEHQGSHANRIFIRGDDGCYPIYAAEDTSSDQGSYIRTYTLFCHQANAWYMHNELQNFLHTAKGFKRFADVGSAEGFYSALFASMHPGEAEILSIDCGSTTGCIPAHSLNVREQNRKAFAPKRWDYAKAFITGSDKQAPSFELPADCQVQRLTEVLQQQNFIPELMKFDIESSEYDALLDPATLDYLQEHQPTLIIEVHNKELSERQLKFQDVLDRLAKLDYAVTAYDDRNFLEIENAHVVMSPGR